MQNSKLGQSLQELAHPEPSAQLDAKIVGGIKQLLALENYQKAEQLLVSEGGHLDQATRANLATGMMNIREQIGPGFQELYNAYREAQQPAPAQDDLQL